MEVLLFVSDELTPNFEFERVKSHFHGDFCSPDRIN